MKKSKSGITTKKVDMNKIISTCIRNDIKIYPVVYKPEYAKGQKSPKCQIEVDIRGKSLTLPDVYRQDSKLYETINELYIKYYNDYFN